MTAYHATLSILPSRFLRHHLMCHLLILVAAPDGHCETRRSEKLCRAVLKVRPTRMFELEGVTKRQLFEATWPANLSVVLCSRSGSRRHATLIATQGGSQAIVQPPEQETQACIGRRLMPPEPEFLVTAHVPVNSCTAPRRHGRITHLPEEVPHGGFWPRPAVLSSTVALVIEV